LRSPSAARVAWICSSTFIAQPVGWVVVQMKPRTLGLMITSDLDSLLE